VPEQYSGSSGKESAESTQRRGNLKTHVPRSSARGKYIARYRRHCRSVAIATAVVVVAIYFKIVLHAKI